MQPRKAVCLTVGLAGLVLLPVSSANAQHGRGAGRSGMPAGRAVGRGGPARAEAAPKAKIKSGGGAERPGKPAVAPRAPGEPVSGNVLRQSPRYAERVRALLPEGIDPLMAAEGFRNRGQFMAAVHVSHNLGIPFEDLKAEMMAGRSLGQAIRQFRPDVDQEQAVERAEVQVRVEARDLDEPEPAVQQ